MERRKVIDGMSALVTEEEADRLAGGGEVLLLTGWWESMRGGGWGPGSSDEEEEVLEESDGGWLLELALLATLKREFLRARRKAPGGPFLVVAALGMLN